MNKIENPNGNIRVKKSAFAFVFLVSCIQSMVNTITTCLKVLMTYNFV